MIDQHAPPIPALKLVSGQLCLDFANTVSTHTDDHPRERLTRYADLVAWSRHVGLVTESEIEQLLATARDQPNVAIATFQQTLALRTAIYGIFAAVAQRVPAPREALETFNQLLATAMAHTCITPTADGYAWTWATDGHRLDALLWPVVRSAAELLTEGDLSRVRECASETCGWLFVDTSKNRSRRWCDMQDCGNVAKVRRFRARQRSDDASTSRS